MTCHRFSRFFKRTYSGALAATLVALLYGSPSVSRAADDTVDVASLLGNEIACAVAGALLADMPIEPVYRVNADAACVPVDPRGREGEPLYSDAACLAPLHWRETTLDTFCARAVDEPSIGLGLDIVDGAWTLAPGSRFDVGARPLDGVTWPYRQRRVFREILTGRGTCQLEMRIYTSQPGATGRHSLIAWHGGSWTNRGFGTLGLELTIPHFVAAGFTVYAPFYRLLGEPATDNAALAACQGSDIAAITEDASAAVDWVLAHADEYGSGGKPVVFGQSAGGHLAVSMAVNRAELIAGAIPFYAPSDFGDFLATVQQGQYDDAQGISVLQRIIGADPAGFDAQASPVPENSFPTIISADPAAYPPMFIVHGQDDSLVEERQSVRLCQALGGESLQALDEPVALAASLREVRTCRTGSADEPESRLHLLREGRHALDICLADVPISDDVCLSGSADSRELVADSIGAAATFALAAAEASVATDPTGGAGGDGNGSAGDGGSGDGGAGDASSGSGQIGPLGLVLLGIAGGWRRRG